MGSSNRRRQRKNPGVKEALTVLVVALVICAIVLVCLAARKGKQPTEPTQTEPISTSTPPQSEPIPTPPPTESTSEPTQVPTESTSEPTEPPTEAPTDAPITATVRPATTPPDDPSVPREVLLTLVNSTHTVPEDWTVDLVILNTGEAVDRRAYPSLQRMINDCRAAGLDPVICSGYRTKDVQTQLYENRVKRWMRDHPGCTEKEARDGAAFWIARPDTSEHQLGFAVDIVSNSNWNLDESQERTATQQWLMQNSWRYGWIMRYPSDKGNITGIGYEPWHYRYVGVEAARDMHETGLCLEEYLGIIDQQTTPTPEDPEPDESEPEEPQPEEPEQASLSKKSFWQAAGKFFCSLS